MKSPAAKRSIAPIDINNISPSPVSGPYAGSTSSMINSSVVIGVGVAVGVGVGEGVGVGVVSGVSGVVGVGVGVVMLLLYTITTLLSPSVIVTF